MCSALPQLWRSSSVSKSALATRDSTGGLQAARLPPCYHKDWMDRIGWYRVVKELGRGAMGVVYHAIDPHIGRPVGIKTIQLGPLRKPEKQDDCANASFARRARPVFASRHRHDLRRCPRAIHRFFRAALMRQRASSFSTAPCHVETRRSNPSCAVTFSSVGFDDMFISLLIFRHAAHCAL
jgi:serine/threonine protein kinase